MKNKLKIEKYIFIRIIKYNQYFQSTVKIRFYSIHQEIINENTTIFYAPKRVLEYPSFLKSSILKYNFNIKHGVEKKYFQKINS